MQIRRPGTKGYEEVDGTINVTIPHDQHPNGIHGDTSTSHMASPEFELASVSVVPDGEILPKKFSLKIIGTNFCRYLYRCTGRKCFRLRLVSSEVIAICRSLLDE